MKFPTLNTSLLKGVFTIQLNQPKLKNAFTPQQYKDTLAALEYAAKSEDIRVVVLTGTGSFYSSGTLLVIPQDGQKPTRQQMEQMVSTTKQWIDLMIDFPKILIAAVNGPCMGIACTTVKASSLMID